MTHARQYSGERQRGEQKGRYLKGESGNGGKRDSENKYLLKSFFFLILTFTLSLNETNFLLI